jgi:hypothetical protein
MNSTVSMPMSIQRCQWQRINDCGGNAPDTAVDSHKMFNAQCSLYHVKRKSSENKINFSRHVVKQFRSRMIKIIVDLFVTAETELWNKLPLIIIQRFFCRNCSNTCYTKHWRCVTELLWLFPRKKRRCVSGMMRPWDKASLGWRLPRCDAWCCVPGCFVTKRTHF